MNKEELIRKAFLIRRFEEKVLLLFSTGKLPGTTHTCIGQEWIGVIAASLAKNGDLIFSNHRSHGHFLAWTGDLKGLLSEIMGKPSGVCGGKGGSQHLYSPLGFYSNGIQGGMVPISVGRAFAEKIKKTENICISFVGDGTLGQGVFYESLNIASRWGVPLLVVVENNKIAQTTPQVETLAGTIKNRAKALDIKYNKSDTWNVEGLLNDFRDAVNYVRQYKNPFLLEIETCRLKAHSKGDDTRNASEISEYEKKDPLNRLLLEEPKKMQHLLREIDTEIESILNEVTQDDPQDIRGSDIQALEKKRFVDIVWEERIFENDRIVNLINKSLKDNFRKNSKIMMIGEDIKSPYGGAFKVSKNLSFEFPDRIINTPISESAIIGIGTGLALSGYIPIVEIMFGDFLTLGFDQLLNHACKFQYMYNDQINVPLIVRTPMGGRRGYGPTHSQSLEKYFIGIPSLNILALNIRVSPQHIYNSLLDDITSPTLVIENKVLYTRFLSTESPVGFKVLFSKGVYPTVKITPSGKNPEITIFCYGGILEEAEKAIQIVFDEYDIICEIICPSLIQPLNIEPVLESVKKTNKLLTVEEGCGIGGVGSEVVSRLLENGIRIDMFRRISCNSFIPSSVMMEEKVLPDALDIVAILKEITNV